MTGSVIEACKLVAPLAVAVLAAWLALLANGRLDRGRAKRELLTKIADGMRDDVRAAVEAAADYWSAVPSNKAVIEARIKMLDQEIRSASVLIDDGNSCSQAVEFRSALQNFLAVLTGADFDSVAVLPNSGQVRDVTGRGVALRKATAQYRRAQLER